MKILIDERRHIIAPDGAYEDYLIRKADGEFVDCIEGRDRFGPLCRGGCEIARESCYGFYGVNAEGGAEFWCMCSRRPQRRRL